MPSIEDFLAFVYLCTVQWYVLHGRVSYCKTTGDRRFTVTPFGGQYKCATTTSQHNHGVIRSAFQLQKLVNLWIWETSINDALYLEEQREHGHCIEHNDNLVGGLDNENGLEGTTRRAKGIILISRHWPHTVDSLDRKEEVLSYHDGLPCILDTSVAALD
jgi:hypothetical protein